MKRSKVIWVMGELFCKFMYSFNVKVSFSEEIIVTLHSVSAQRVRLPQCEAGYAGGEPWLAEHQGRSGLVAWTKL